MQSHLSVQKTNGAAIVTIERESSRNALARQTLREFGALRNSLASDAKLRAIIITGSGDRAFCAGADLKERQGMDEAAIRSQLRAYRTELGWLDQSPIPVVAAINGFALGGGLELALICDLRIATTNAVLGLPETSLGIIPGAGGTQRLTRLLGEARAKEMILLGQRIDVKRAHQWGLVHRVADASDNLLQETLDWIEPILSGAPIAQASALAAIDAAAELPLDAGLERELELYEACLISEDRQEALKARAAKRKPVFRGR